MAIYKSQHKGEIIDEAVKRVIDILINKTAILPVEVGGTGQTSIDGIKSMLGMDETQYDVQPINKGGTGATTAADARTNLGVTPGNIGAAPASEHNMKSYTSLWQIGLSGAPTMDEIQQALPNSSRLVFNPSTSGYAEGTGTANIPSLYGMVVMEKIDPSRWDISFRSKTGSNELWVGTKGENSGAAAFNQWVKIPSTATLASDIQSLLQGGSISVVKSIQRGTITIAGHQTEGYATLATSVNTSKAVVLYGGQYNIQETSGKYNPVMLQLSAANKVTATLYALSAYSWQIPYQVIEYY